MPPAIHFTSGANRPCGIRSWKCLSPAVSRRSARADWSTRYPNIASAVGQLSCPSCLLDGEVVICGEDGIPIFDRLRYGRAIKIEAVLFAFDLLELDGRDLRREAIELRKAALAKLLRKAPVRLQLSEHIEEPGDIVF
jgi:bifunctional non-homologous end joining protein LigD